MRLSDFKDEKGVEVVAKLLMPIGRIAANQENAKAMKAVNEEGGNLLSFASALLCNSPRDVMDMLAILNDEDPADYRCSAATVLVDVFNMISDPELLALFGLQRQNPASSGSASESTEAPAPPARSSATPARKSNRRRKKKPNVVGAKYLGGFIRKKIRAGGNKIQDTVNQQIRNSNQNANLHNAEVDKQIALAEQKCVAIRQRVSQIDMSWYPPDYCFSTASAFFYKAINNGMCETLGEAVKLYEEQRYRDQVLANQQKQIDLAYKQIILQAMTIATLHQEGAATRETMQAEGATARQTMQAEGAAAREQRAQQYKDFRRRTGL